MLTRLRSVWRDALALLYAIRDPRTPAGARGLAALALVYLLSPIDLLPDSIPGLGLVDDIMIVPALLALAARLLPAPVLEGARERSAGLARRLPYLVAGTVLLLVGLTSLVGHLLLHGLSA